jgi:hypothetical protein
MNRSVAARSGEAMLEFDEATQQSIESPGVGDSFSFRKETTISHSRPLVFRVQPYKAGALYACRSVLEEVDTGG